MIARFRKKDLIIDDAPETSLGQVLRFFAVIAILFIVFYFIKDSVNDKKTFASIATAIGGTLAFIFAFVNLELAAVVLIFIFPIVAYDIPGMPFYFTFGDGFLIILTFAWVIRLLVGKEERIKASFLDRPIYFYMILSLFSMVNSIDTFAGLKEIIQSFEFFIFTYFIFQSVIKTREGLDLLLVELALSSIGISLYGVWQYFAFGAGQLRVVSTFAHFNAFGAYLAFLIPLFFNMFISEKVRWRRWVFAAALAANSLAVLFTFSRGAWIGVLVGLFFSGQIRGMQQFIRVTGTVLVLLVVATLFIPASAKFVGRAASITQFSDKSTQSRFDQYKIAEEIITNSPFFGVGLGSLPYYAQNRGTPTLGEIHNIALFTAAERGLPALFALLSIFFVFLYRLYQRVVDTPYTFFRTFYIAIMSGTISFLIVNMTAYHLVRGLGVLLGIFLGAGVAATRIEHELLEAGDFAEETESSVLMRSPDLIGHFAPSRGGR